jgi:methionine synthase I (cobalamin-dependent)
MVFDRILVFDGGVGTELYERGFYINRPFEELNLNAAADVIAVHKAYISAGADVITTNTFSIARHQLQKFDIEGQQKTIIRAALENARKATHGTNCLIAFSMGPLGVLVEPLGPTALSEAETEYRKITENCVEFGAPDFYILETFTNVDELLAAVSGIRLADPKTPIIASMALRSNQEEKLLDFAIRAGELETVDALGINCSDGPSDLLTTLGKLVLLTKKPLIVQPNAGVPQNINGRVFLNTTPP